MRDIDHLVLRIEIDFMLQQNVRRAFDQRAALFNVLRRDIGACRGNDHDFVLRGYLVHHDQRNAGFLLFIDQDIIGVHALRGIEIRGDLAENIVAHLGDQRNVCARAMRGDRLIGTLSAGAHLEGAAQNRLSRNRQTLGTSGKIYDKAAKYYDRFAHMYYLLSAIARSSAAISSAPSTMPISRWEKRLCMGASISCCPFSICAGRPMG